MTDATTRKRILVTEKIADSGLDILRAKGYEVSTCYGMSAADLASAVAGYDALIVRSATQVDADIIEAGANLRVIGRAGVGIDNIDVAAATEADIIVCNAPLSNVVSAAEQTMCLMLACARKTPQADASMKAGKWERGSFVGTELFEKTLAIFGLGRIGSLVAERARAFGMNLVAYDPYCSPEQAQRLGVKLYDTIEEILPLADVITVHLPKTPETIGMFGPEEYAAMKDGVILVNVACGGIYNVESLADFIAAGKIGAAGIDVYEKEPCTESPLHEFDNVILTPHLGASTHEAQERAGVQIAEYVAAGLEGSVVPTAVNMTPLSPEMMDVMGPYIFACRMLGLTLAQIAGKTPASLTVTAAGTLAAVDAEPLVAGALGGILRLRTTEGVSATDVAAMASRRGIKVSTASQSDAYEYASTVRLQADDLEVAATISGSATPRIVSLLGYRIDIAPAKHSLVFEYVDAPGRIGTIGTILGNAGVNITTMQIGTKPEEQCALVYMNVEGDVGEDVITELRGAIALKNLWDIAL